MSATDTENTYTYSGSLYLHCGLPGNEKSYVLAKEASSMPQEDVPVDVLTITKAVSRSASKP